MSKDPAFLFYSSDFLTGTMFLTNEQIGKFIKLLCVQHQKGRLREKDMLKICKTYDEDVFEMFKKDDENLFYNERLEVEVNKRKAYSESRRNNRKKKTVIPKNTSKTYVKHMEDENENENINTNKTKKEKLQIIYPFGSEDFINVWDIWKEYRKTSFKKTYKAKASEQAALKRLSNMAVDCADAIEIIEFCMAQGWQGFYKEKKDSNYGRKNNSNTGEWSDDFRKEIDGYLQS
tara:strand:+ start:2982 stop:3680 length:699 start_codon:yes stop_codon:yes gene_type:complete